MKIIICGILGGLVVIAIVIWFPILSNTKYEIVEKEEPMLRCQQIILEYFDIYNTLASFDRGSATLQEIQTFNEKYTDLVEKKMEKFTQNVIKYNCEDTKSEWLTPEFEGKLKFFTEYNFLP